MYMCVSACMVCGCEGMGVSVPSLGVSGLTLVRAIERRFLPSRE